MILIVVATPFDFFFANISSDNCTNYSRAPGHSQWNFEHNWMLKIEHQKPFAWIRRIIFNMLPKFTILFFIYACADKIWISLYFSYRCSEVILINCQWYYFGFSKPKTLLVSRQLANHTIATGKNTTQITASRNRTKHFCID